VLQVHHPVHFLDVRQRQPGRRQRDQRRAPARFALKDDVALFGGVHQVHDLLRARHALLIGLRVPCEGDLTAIQVDGITLFGVHAAGRDPVAQDVLQRPGLALRRLAPSGHIDIPHLVQVKNQRDGGRRARARGWNKAQRARREILSPHIELVSLHPNGLADVGIRIPGLDAGVEDVEHDAPPLDIAV